MWNKDCKLSGSQLQGVENEKGENKMLIFLEENIKIISKNNFFKNFISRLSLLFLKKIILSYAYSNNMTSVSTCRKHMPRTGNAIYGKQRFIDIPVLDISLQNQDIYISRGRTINSTHFVFSSYLSSCKFKWVYVNWMTVF